ncbi:MAG TPA: ribonuclease H family protein [Tissierellaceae bacterium]|nr:ribonuclease H family protein [Tissierellaceae bacterium]
MSKYYYGVQIGKKPGVYKSWPECQTQVNGYKGAIYKKFKDYKEALAFAKGENIDSKNNNLVEEKDLKKNEMIAYVDGSFNQESKAYGYGVVLITKDGKEELKGKGQEPDLVEMRNVSGELKAAMLAMDVAKGRGVDTLYLHYDYSGIEQWALGNWKTNKIGTKQYKDYYDSIKDELKVVFIKVAAHTGVKYNEEADRLAKEALL